MTITFKKEFKDVNYIILTEANGMISNSYGEGISIQTKSTTGFTCHSYHGTAVAAETGDWKAFGYINF